MREKGKDFPVIMLSVMNDAITKVGALNNGADDYLAKPFFMAELLARIRALIATAEDRCRAGIYPCRPAEDIALHSVSRNGKPVELNRKEFGLLECLHAKPGHNPYAGHDS